MPDNFNDDNAAETFDSMRDGITDREKDDADTAAEAAAITNSAYDGKLMEPDMSSDSEASGQTVSDPFSINIVDINDFASVQVEPGAAYVVTGEGLDNPVLVYPDENGNIHAVDSFYLVDGMLMSGSEIDPLSLDPITGDAAQPIENVMDYIDSRMMDSTDSSFENIMNDLENTSFEVQADTGLLNDEHLPDDIVASQMFYPEPDMLNDAYMPDQDPAANGLQDPLMDMMTDPVDTGVQNNQEFSADNSYYDDMGMNMENYGNDPAAGFDMTNDLGFQDNIMDANTGIDDWQDNISDDGSGWGLMD